jgi:hypothetical protein
MPRPQTDMAAPVELLPERRVLPPTEASLSRIDINQDRLAKSYNEFLAQLQKEIDDQKLLAAQQHEEITDRLNRHSEDIANHGACLTRAVDAFEERMRKESASRLTSEHRAILRQKEFLDGLAQWAAATATIQTAVAGLQEATATMQRNVASLSDRHEKDTSEAEVALKEHVKREGALTKAGVMSPIVFGLILTAVWYVFGPTIRKGIDAALQLAIGAAGP